MASSTALGRVPRPVIAAVALVVLLGGWLVSRMYTNDAARACAHRYREAYTAADSALVDDLVPDLSHALQTCGMIRTNARWK